MDKDVLSSVISNPKNKFILKFKCSTIGKCLIKPSNICLMIREPLKIMLANSL